jgi:hypothetical protein
LPWEAQGEDLVGDLAGVVGRLGNDAPGRRGHQDDAEAVAAARLTSHRSGGRPRPVEAGRVTRL